MKLKKFLTAALALVVIVPCALLLSACNGNASIVDYEADYQTASASEVSSTLTTLSESSSAEAPAYQYKSTSNFTIDGDKITTVTEIYMSGTSYSDMQFSATIKQTASNVTTTTYLYYTNSTIYMNVYGEKYRFTVDESEFGEYDESSTSTSLLSGVIEVLTSLSADDQNSVVEAWVSEDESVQKFHLKLSNTDLSDILTDVISLDTMIESLQESFEEYGYTFSATTEDYMADIYFVFEDSALAGVRLAYNTTSTISLGAENALYTMTMATDEVIEVATYSGSVTLPSDLGTYTTISY